MPCDANPVAGLLVFDFVQRAAMLPSYEPVPNYAGKMFQPMPAVVAPKSDPAKHTL